MTPLMALLLFAILPVITLYMGIGVVLLFSTSLAISRAYSLRDGILRPVNWRYEKCRICGGAGYIFTVREVR